MSAAWPLHHGWVVVGAALCVATVAYAVHYSFGIFFKPLAAEFNWTRAMTSGAFSFYMLSRGGFGIITGWTTDKYGPTITVAGGGFFIGLGLLLTSQINSLWQLYISYSVLVAFGVSVAFAPLLATVARWFAMRRGLATGIVLTGVGLGTAIMARPASYLTHTYGWSTSYMIMGVTALIIIILAALLLKQSPMSIGLLPYGTTGTTTEPGFDVASNKVNSMHRKAGVTLQEAIHTGSFWILFIITVLFATALYMVMVHVVPHVTDLGFSVPTAGSILAVIGISTIVGRLAVGWLSDMIGRKSALTICLFLQAATIFLLMVIKDVNGLYIFGLIFGLVYGGIVTQLPLIAGEMFGLHSLGAIVGLEMLGTSFGGSIGPFLGGLIYDVTDSYSFAFLFSVIGLLIAITLTFPLKIQSREERSR